MKLINLFLVLVIIFCLTTTAFSADFTATNAGIKSGVSLISVTSNKDLFQVGEQAKFTALIEHAPTNPRYRLYLKGYFPKNNAIYLKPLGKVYQFISPPLLFGIHILKVKVFIENAITVDSLKKARGKLRREIVELKDKLEDTTDTEEIAYLNKKVQENQALLNDMRKEIDKCRLFIETVEKEIVVQASETITAQNGGTVEIPNEVSLNIPADSLSQNTKISINFVSEIPQPTEPGLHILKAYDFQPEGTSFDPPAEIVFYYNPQDIIQIGLTEEDLDIYYYDAQAGLWVKTNGSVDVENNKITNLIDHFSFYALGGEEGQQIEIANTIIPNGVEENYFEVQFSANGGHSPYIWNCLNCSLNEIGLTLDQFNGKLSGTPIKGSAGTYSLIIEVEDSSGKKDQANFVLKIYENTIYRWTNQIGGAEQYNSANIKFVRTDKEGNQYLCGYFSGTVNFAANWGQVDYKTSPGDISWIESSFITKISKDNNYEWTRILHPARNKGRLVYISDFKINSKGDIYVVGDFWGEYNFAQSWNLVDQKSSIDMYNMYITKINNDGTYDWTRQTTGIYQDEISTSTEPSQIEFDSFDNLYIAGDFQGIVNFASDWRIFDIKSTLTSMRWFLVRINADGTYGWTRKLNVGTWHLPIAIDKNDNVYLAASYSGTKNFAEDWGIDDYKSSEYWDDLCLTKVLSDGSYGWTLVWSNDFRWYEVLSLSVVSENNVYIASVEKAKSKQIPFTGESIIYRKNRDGSISWAVDGKEKDEAWQPLERGKNKGRDDERGIAITKTINVDQQWIAKISGVNIDYGQWMGDYYSRLLQDYESNIYFKGIFRGTKNFGEFWNLSDIKTAQGDSDTYVLKINNDGSYGWTKRIGGVEGEYMQDIEIDLFQNLYLGGYFEGSINFAEDWKGSDVKTAVDESAFVSKVSLFPLPKIINESLPKAQENTLYYAKLETTEAKALYTWSCVSGDLSNLGLSLDSATGEIKGLVTGTSGTYLFSFKIIDSFGQEDLKVLSIKVFYDISSPELTVTAPINNSHYTTDFIPFHIQFFDELSGINTDSINISINFISVNELLSITNTDAIGEIPIEQFKEGINIINIEVADGQGNKGFKQMCLFIDRLPPVINISPQGGQIGTHPLIEISYSDEASGINIDSLMIKLNNEEITNKFTKDLTKSFLQLDDNYNFTEGEHVLEVELSDNVGTQKTETVTYIVDIPEITTQEFPIGKEGVAYYAQLMTEGGSFPYTWRYTGSDFEQMGLIFNPYTGEISGTANDVSGGTHEYVFKVTDFYERSSEKELSLRIYYSEDDYIEFHDDIFDGPPPVLPFDLSFNFIGDENTISVKLDGIEINLYLTINGNLGTISANAISVLNLGRGTHTYTVTLTTEIGEYSESLSFYYDPGMEEAIPYDQQVIIESTDQTALYYGTGITIPANALSQNATLYLMPDTTPMNPTPFYYEFIGEGFSWGIEGAELVGQINIRVKFSPSRIPKDRRQNEIVVIALNEVTGKYEEIVPSSVDSVNGFVYFSETTLAHSNYVPVVKPDPNSLPVDSMPRNADILVDGSQIEFKTPYIIPNARDRGQIVIHKEGYNVIFDEVRFKDRAIYEPYHMTPEGGSSATVQLNNNLYDGMEFDLRNWVEGVDGIVTNNGRMQAVIIHNNGVELIDVREDGYFFKSVGFNMMSSGTHEVKIKINDGEEKTRTEKIKLIHKNFTFNSSLYYRYFMTCGIAKNVQFDPHDPSLSVGIIAGIVHSSPEYGNVTLARYNPDAFPGGYVEKDEIWAGYWDFLSLTYLPAPRGSYRYMLYVQNLNPNDVIINWRCDGIMPDFSGGSSGGVRVNANTTGWVELYATEINPPDWIGKVKATTVHDGKSCSLNLFESKGCPMSFLSFSNEDAEKLNQPELDIHRTVYLEAKGDITNPNNVRWWARMISEVDDPNMYYGENMVTFSNGKEYIDGNKIYEKLHLRNTYENRNDFVHQGRECVRGENNNRWNKWAVTSEPIKYIIYAKIKDPENETGIHVHTVIWQNEKSQLRQEYVDFRVENKSNLPVPKVSILEEDTFLKNDFSYKIGCPLLDNFNNDLKIKNDQKPYPDKVEYVVSSRFRNPRRNYCVGGARNSYHVWGQAIDYAPTDFSQNNNMEMRSKRLEWTADELRYDNWNNYCIVWPKAHTIGGPLGWHLHIDTSNSCFLKRQK